MNHRYTTSVICHPIKESDIPKTNDSIIDAGYFVVSDKLNETVRLKHASIPAIMMGGNGVTVKQ